MPGKENIILTGFMGTGKTTVGRLLAESLGYDFIDTDTLIVSRYKKSIAEIFKDQGEASFREIEAQIALELSMQEGLVISTGGRMMLNPRNVSVLEKTGKVFCLTASPKEILKRISADPGAERPLLQGENPLQRIIQLLEERQSGYSRFTQIITSNKPPKEIVLKIKELL